MMEYPYPREGILIRYGKFHAGIFGRNTLIFLTAMALLFALGRMLNLW
jgi:hypothetical protein